MNRVVIASTGAANLASVIAAFRRLDQEPVVSEDPKDISEARWVVLPGVGAFGPAKEALDGSGLTNALKARVREGKPLLGICLGMQLLTLASEESPGTEGLGLFSGRVNKFSGPGLRIPHLGWNRVEPIEGSRFLRPGFASYANSYKLDKLPEGTTGAYSVHGDRFVAAFEKGDILACQFHPELSGQWGHELLQRWLEASC